jgi:hypothetical protein
MLLSISQPTLFPWLGYFDIIKKSDIFIFLDTVKFEKRSWHMRNKIKLITPNKEEFTWIRIPTKIENSETMIKDVLIDNTQKWKKQHLNAFHEHYGKNVDEIKFIFKIYEKNWEKLSDFNIEFITECCKFLKIKTNLVKTSEYDFEGKKSQLLLNICKKFSATEYLSTIGAKEYLEKDKEIFNEEKIKIVYHQYNHPTYKQKGKKFIENLSILDLIFNEKIDYEKLFKK